MKLVCIGDSIVAGVPFSKKESIPAFMAEQTGWEVINQGVVNGTVGNMDAVLEKALAQQPEAILVLCGGNDATYGAEDARGIYRRILELAQKIIDAGILPILVTPPKCFPHMVPASNREEIAIGAHCGINLVDRLYDRANITLSGVYELMRKDRSDKPQFFVDLAAAHDEYGKLHDGLHASLESYHFMADTIVEHLKQYYQ